MGFSLMALSIAMMPVASAQAGCPTVRDVITGTQYLGEGDACTIGAGGAIITSGYYEDAISAWTDNTITNNGRISTSGSSSVGISGLENGTVVNNGEIATAGDYADAISLFNGNAITNSGSISTRGMFATGIVGFDRNAVTNSGTITAGGNYGSGISLYSDNTVLNSGEIATTGADGVAISLSDNNRLTNEGNIRTDGDSAHGISLQGGNSVTNSGQIITGGRSASGITGFDGNIITIASGGRIETSGETANGINLWDNNTVANAGTITTTGSSAAAISVNDGNEIGNTGHIETGGNDAAGLTAGNGNAITNGGTIATSGAGAAGMRLGQDNSITNDGTISATGSDAPGIVAGGSGTIITNNGTILSAHSWAIRADAGNTTIINAGLISGHATTSAGGSDGTISFSGTGNVLTLLPGSRITGLVGLGDATTVNIRTGQPMVLHVDDVTHGTFVAPGQQLVIDPNNNLVIVRGASGYRERTRAGGLTIGLLTDGISSLLFGAPGSRETVVTAASGTGKALQTAPGAEDVRVMGGTFIGRRKGRKPATWNTTYGGLLALRFRPATGVLFGLHGGGGHTKTEGQRGRDAWFLGLHGRLAANGAWLAGIFSLGKGGSSGGTFTYLDNLAPGGMRSFSTVRKAAFVSGEGRAGVTFALPGAPTSMTLSPELMVRITRVRLRYLNVAMPFRVNDGRRFTMFDGRAQVTVAFALPSSEGADARMLLTTGVARHDERGKVYDRTTGFGGVRLEMLSTEGLHLLLGGEAHVGKGGLVGYAASLGVRARF